MFQWRFMFYNNEQLYKASWTVSNPNPKYMGLPTSLCTSDQYSNSCKIFDKIIKLKEGQPNNKRYYDTVDFKTLNFKNYSRCKSYDLSPYDKTLVLDVDYIITNNKLSDAFINGDFKIYKHGVDLCPWRKYKEFDPKR